MRIIGYIDHPSIKITVFKMDNRFSVKFETGLYEQIFKFREGGQMSSLDDVKRLLDESFLAFVLMQFGQMHQAKMEALGRLSPAQGSAFEEII